MKAKTLSIPVFSFRRIETPYERRLGYRNYVAVIDAKHLPDLSDWREINVREAKTRGRVPNAIRKSFGEKADEFLFMNRGLVIAADHVDFKEGSSQKRIDLVWRILKSTACLMGATHIKLYANRPRSCLQKKRLVMFASRLLPASTGKQSATW